jgi:phosphocarrier protein HPr
VPVTSGEVVIKGEVGLHARPAADFVREAEKYESEVWLVRDGGKVNGKSILGILTLAAEKGTVLILEVDGVDEEDAFKALKARLESIEA